jgi:hypothetical protein
MLVRGLSIEVLQLSDHPWQHRFRWRAAENDPQFLLCADEFQNAEPAEPRNAPSTMEMKITGRVDACH